MQSPSRIVWISNHFEEKVNAKAIFGDSQNGSNNGLNGDDRLLDWFGSVVDSRILSYIGLRALFVRFFDESLLIIVLINRMWFYKKHDGLCFCFYNDQHIFNCCVGI